MPSLRVLTLMRTFPGNSATMNLTAFLASAVCVLVVVGTEVRADTIPSELYCFSTRGNSITPVDQAVVRSSVLLRVSGLRERADQYHSWCSGLFRPGRNELVLFEFLLPDEAAGLLLREVRIRDCASVRGVALRELQGVFGIRRDGILRDSVRCQREIGPAGLTIDLESFFSKSGLRPNAGVGLLFELGHGVSIDSLLNGRLASHELQVEIRVGTASGQSIWAVLSGSLSSNLQDGRPARSLDSEQRILVAVAGSSWIRQAALDVSAEIFESLTRTPSLRQFFVPRVLVFVPCGVRPREPPCLGRLLPMRNWIPCRNIDFEIDKIEDLHHEEVALRYSGGARDRWYRVCG